MQFLISLTYPDETPSSVHHTERPFDHLSVNFMLFFSAKNKKGVQRSSLFYFSWRFRFVGVQRWQSFQLIEVFIFKSHICMPNPHTHSTTFTILTKLKLSTFFLYLWDKKENPSCHTNKNHTTVRLKSDLKTLEHQSNSYTISYFFSLVDD